MKVIGISAFFHDSAAALVADGRLVAAVQEERFTRKKHDDSFPLNAINYCLRFARVDYGQLDAVVFYDRPVLKLHRILSTFMDVAPRGLSLFVRVIPVWLKQKIWIKAIIEEYLGPYLKLSEGELPIYFVPHHISHAASAFLPSPFYEAAIITADGVGEWATTTLGLGKNTDLTILKVIEYPHSIGLLYSAFTYYLGFEVNEGEYKLMGLAAYGQPVYSGLIMDELIDVKEDGSFRLNLKYFNFLENDLLINDKFCSLFGLPARPPGSFLSRKHADIAASIQYVLEYVLLKMACYVRQLTTADYLCMAGGIALNCVANSKILKGSGFKDVWVQPAAGDAGGAAGSALFFVNSLKGIPRVHLGIEYDGMSSAVLGPEFSSEECRYTLNKYGLKFSQYDDSELSRIVASIIAKGAIVGVFRGRMEFGPRALGHRSILADPRDPEILRRLNEKIKLREKFRPFAPVVLEERANDYFNIINNKKFPYMLFVSEVKEKRRKELPSIDNCLLSERFNEVRSDIPAVTHADFTARIQTVTRFEHPFIYDILKEFEKLTGYGILLNTSFNRKGEPIVCSPDDAVKCFIGSGMDALILENFVVLKERENENFKSI